MKGRSSFEQEIRTVKYLNQHQHSQEMPDGRESNSSQVVTERRSPSEEDYSIRINHPHKQYPKSPFFQKHTHQKVVVIETLEHLPQQKETHKNIAQPPKHKHKKGKSMDLEAYRNSQPDRNPPSFQEEPLKSKGKVIVNSQFIHEFRNRNNISEMRDYNFTKKVGTGKKAVVDVPQNSKKKKPKSNCSSEFKDLRREFKPMMTTAPVLTTKRKDSTGKISSKTQKVTAAIKTNKMTSRSTELFHHKDKLNHTRNELFNTGITMPLTSKLQSLYSNTTSVFSSRTDLALHIYNQRQSCVIPTEESLDEIPEIRRYESLAIHDMKRSSKNLPKMSNKSLVGELEEDKFQNSKQSTHKIIDYYLNYFNSADLNEDSGSSVSKEIKKGHVELRQREEDSLKRIKSVNSEIEMLRIPAEGQTAMPQGIVSKEIVSTEERELVKLNEIIDLIHSKQTVTNEQKYAILNKIKELLPNHENSKQEVQPATPKSIEIPEMDLNNSLRESMTSQEQISNLNLQILDRTLRERQHYLRDRQNKELDRLEDIKERMNNEQYESQRDKIIKWTQHEIKEVVHTRVQLWKGFNFAKNVLSGESNSKNEKKREMMRCLSEKYITKSQQQQQKPLKKQKRQGKLRVELNESAENSQEVTSPAELNKARYQTNKLQEQFPNISPLRQSQILHQQVLRLLAPEREKQIDENSSEEEREPFQIGQHSPILNVQQKIQILHPKEIKLFQLNDDEKKEKRQRLVCEIDCDYSFNHIGTPQPQRDSPNRDILNSEFSIFRYATLSDKEDICEFIFLDLCIELTDEYASTTPMMRKIRQFIKRAKELSKRLKGFKTNSFAIKDYLHNMITYLKTQPDLLQEIHNNLDRPIGPTAVQILRYMHPSEQVNEEECDDNVNILHCKIFERFQQIYLSKVPIEQYYDEEDKEKKRRIFLKNAMHVHNKAIFDCVNELLDRERLFGLWGEPFSWKKSPKFKHIRDGKMKNDAILKCAQRTIEYGTYLCGFMVDKEDCNFKDNPNVTQTYIDQIRYDRLSRMMAQQLDEGEEKMLFLDDEETQYLVELGQSLFDRLILECIAEFSYFI